MSSVSPVAGEPLRTPGNHPGLDAAPGMPLSHVAHHFDTAQQQYDASKLGMWLFLATEVLLFAGLFCVYAVFRSAHPEVFRYGAQFIDARWGAINTIVLICSSFTMAMAVRSAQLRKPRQVMSFLLLTFAGGIGFLGIKYIEYLHKLEEGLLYGTRYYEKPDWVRASETLERARAVLLAPIETPEIVLLPGDAERGLPIWAGTCASCHGSRGEGLKGSGLAVGGTAFVTERTDEELLAFILAGRSVDAPNNTTGVAMPPRGGNPLSTDQDLLDAIAYMRTLEPVDAATADGESSNEAATQVVPVDLPRSWIPAGSPGPPGFVRTAQEESPGDHDEHRAFPHHSVDPQRPPVAHAFFGIYFALTGLHGLHVVAGLGVIAWLIVRTSKGHFSSGYYTPVDLGGLYWHLVDLIWIFLFPLLYLID